MKKKKIEILLVKEVRTLGNSGQIVKVKSGYSRNYLLPYQIGKIPTTKTINEFQIKQKEILLKEENLLEKFITLKIAIEALGTLIIKKEVVSDTTQLFGKVTRNDILILLEERLGFTKTLEKNQLQLPSINKLGNYVIEINLGKNIIAQIPVQIIAN
uniref:Large ribosomal subunit protein bL9c n=1 Tax=Dictyopteris divaricata TaxID=156996 RepID=A0A2I4Q2K9_9PHAE|nr:50S ribosomal protein L9 [Dictyopteris divaricata]YP_010205371.1 50S ribosomal protein L9 [Grateloupia livida]AQZ25082.1 50S ribosomal protein L9 [Dictyopteris divaricata]UAV85940.1 50S ribosomal protein L9 [Grateloupia livida]